jgi:hypothetical protein
MSAKVSVSITIAQCKLFGVPLWLVVHVVPPTCGSPTRTTAELELGEEQQCRDTGCRQLLQPVLRLEYSAPSRASNGVAVTYLEDTLSDSQVHFNEAGPRLAS